MNGLTRKQTGFGGAGAMVLGLGLILIPGSGPSQHASAVVVGSVGAVSSSTSTSPAPTTTTPQPGTPPPTQTTSGTPTTPLTPMGSATPPQPGPMSPAPPPHTTPSKTPAPPVNPAPTSPPPPPTSPKTTPPPGCPSGTGWSGDAFSPIAGTQHSSCWGLSAGESTADDPARGGSQDLGHLADGAWGEYPRVDFGGGASQFYGRVASGAPAGVSGRVQVHLDKLSNPAVAIFEIANTGGWQTWKTVPMNMARTTGVHDVYVTFDSGQPQAFVSLHWFDFGN